jgi:hypothetical protein
LKILQFEIDSGIKTTAEVIGINQGGFEGDAFEYRCGLVDFFKAKHGCIPQGVRLSEVDNGR